MTTLPLPFDDADLDTDVTGVEDHVTDGQATEKELAAEEDEGDDPLSRLPQIEDDSDDPDDPDSDPEVD